MEKTIEELNRQYEKTGRSVIVDSGIWKGYGTE